MSEQIGPREGYLWALHVHGASVTSLRHAPLPPALDPGEGWLWAHFGLSDQRARNFVAHGAGFPAPVAEVLLGEDCSPRILLEGDWIYGALPDLERDIHGAVAGPGRLRFAFNARVLVTTRRHALHVVHDFHQMMEAGFDLPASPLDAFTRLTLLYADEVEARLDQLAHVANQIEDKVLDERADLKDLSIGPARQALSRHHREVAALRTAVSRAQARTRDGAAISATLKLMQQRVEDLHHEVTAIAERCRLIHEEIDTRINAATNRTLGALTVMSALLMPPTLIAGAFGMNVEGIAFAHSRTGFAVVCLFMLGTIAMTYILLVRLRVLR